MARIGGFGMIIKELGYTSYIMKRILIIDDDKDILLLMQSFFLSKGHEVRTSTTCSGAWAIVLEFHPDIIFLDINVGDEDGRYFCKELKKKIEWLQLPVYFISANVDESERFHQYGASGFFHKPFLLTSLLEVL